MKAFDVPEIEVKMFDVADVLTTSGDPIEEGETLADYGIEDCGAAA